MIVKPAIFAYSRNMNDFVLFGRVTAGCSVAVVPLVRRTQRGASPADFGYACDFATSAQDEEDTDIDDLFGDAPCSVRR